MMSSVNYQQETQHTFLPALLAFVRFSIWSLFNALFLLFVGQDSAFMDKFPIHVVEVTHEDETVTKPSVPIIETCGGNSECHQENLTQELVMFAQEGSSIDATFVQAPLPEKKKNNQRRKKEKTPKKDSAHAVGKDQPKSVDEAEWTTVASKRTSNPAKLPKEKEVKPQEQKKAEKQKKNTPKKETAQPKQSKAQKLESGKPKSLKAEAPVLHIQHAPIAHSMLKRNYHVAVDVPLVKPIRQPIGPPTTGGFGFSSEYRKSRMSAVMAH